jgi:beta-glucosidase
LDNLGEEFIGRGIDQINPDYSTSVSKSIDAGIDMNMVPFDYHKFIDTLTAAVQNVAVPVSGLIMPFGV